MSPAVTWGPAILLGVGALLSTVGVKAQREMPLRAELATSVPDSITGFVGTDREMSDAEFRVVGVSSYLLRLFAPVADSSASAISLYVGYYARQTQGRTIHSPRNCLPGGGWEPLTNQVAAIAIGPDTIRVNRYLIQNGQQQALVLYWYQGRGRVAHNEYLVKLDLLRDAALKRRSEEALVRIVVPVTVSEAAAYDQAVAFVRAVLPGLREAFPAA